MGEGGVHRNVQGGTQKHTHFSPRIQSRKEGRNAGLFILAKSLFTGTLDHVYSAAIGQQRNSTKVQPIGISTRRSSVPVNIAYLILDTCLIYD